MSTISSGTTLTTGYVVTSDTTGTLVFQVNGTTTAATLSATGNLTLNTGNLIFGGTAQRITGDMSTATFGNRLAFQTSTSNSATSISALPNGTGTASNINCYNNSDPTNSSLLLAGTNASEALIQSAIRGTGTYLPMTFYTGGSERVRIDTSGNVGIGGTAAIAFVKCQINGTLPTSGNLSIGFSQDAAIPSGTTSLYAGFNSAAGTQAASFTLTSYAYYRASQGTFGAGSAVTNQYGYLAESTIIGATNNFGFFSNIASGTGRWNFYAGGTANNYFAGQTDVGNTRLIASNSWNGAHVRAANTITLASGASIDLSTSLAGGAIVSVYASGSGNGGLFWVNYSQTVTKLVGNGEATDTGGDFAVYKSAASHTSTLKNKAGSTQIFYVAVLSGQLI